MTYLKKEDILFERDGEGKLLPVEVELETLSDKPKIRATPLTKGELSEIVSNAQSGNTNKDIDIDIVIKHCKEPSFSEEDREALKSAGKAAILNAIVLGIFSISTGVSQDQISEEGKKAVITSELDELKKK